MIGIVILNYNNVNETIECIKSIKDYCHKDNYRICLVDNNSETNVVEEVSRRLHDIYPDNSMTELSSNEQQPSALPILSYIKNGENCGYANGNNIGLRFFENYDEIKYLLILNNDVLFTSDILSVLRNYLAEHPGVGVVSPLLYGRNGKIDHECARYEKRYVDFLLKVTRLGRFSFLVRANESHVLVKHPDFVNKTTVEINLPSGSCMMFKKAVFKDIGYFDPNTFLYYEEDILWKKLKASSYSSVLLPQVSCIHLGACSTSKRASYFIRKSYRDSMLYYLRTWTNFSRIFVCFIELRTWLNLKMVK